MGGELFASLIWVSSVLGPLQEKTKPEESVRVMRRILSHSHLSCGNGEIKPLDFTSDDLGRVTSQSDFVKLAIEVTEGSDFRWALPYGERDEAAARAGVIDHAGYLLAEYYKQRPDDRVVSYLRTVALREGETLSARKAVAHSLSFLPYPGLASFYVEVLERHGKIAEAVLFALHDLRLRGKAARQRAAYTPKVARALDGYFVRESAALIPADREFVGELKEALKKLAAAGFPASEEERQPGGAPLPSPQNGPFDPGGAGKANLPDLEEPGRPQKYVWVWATLAFMVLAVFGILRHVRRKKAS